MSIAFIQAGCFCSAVADDLTRSRTMDMMIGCKTTILNSCPKSERSVAERGASPPSEKIYAFLACMAVKASN
jgi:hypothetical protein